MTREGAIKIIKECRDFESYTHVREALDMAIKALESKDVLDKIRSEIEEQREEASNKNSEDDKLTNYYFGLNDGLKDARDIVDKYRAEGEEV